MNDPLGWSNIFVCSEPWPFTDAEALEMAGRQGFAPGRVRLEERQEGDCVQQADGSFLVTYRFTLLPEADEPEVIERKP